MVLISNLTKKYGDFTALNNINLNINTGDIVGLLGPNGAGKTSLMRVIAGFMTAEEGDCIVNGYEIHADTLKAQSFIGYLPEEPPLYPEMRVIDQLLFVAKIKGVSQKSLLKRLDYVLESVGIQARKRQIIGTLSKGYRQRVGIAMSLINDPKLLILDEPTIGLDPNQILEIRHLIKKLAGDRTVIISSHILPEITSFCNRLVIISEGKIIAEDTTEGLIKLSDGFKAIKIICQNISKMTKAEQKDLIESFELDRIEFLGTNTIIIYRPKISDIAHLIPKYLVKRGIEFSEFAPYGQSLENVFRKLTLKDV